MKQKCLRVFVATPLLAAISLSAQSFGGARLVQSAEPAQPQHQYIQKAAFEPSPAPQQRRVRRRSKKKSAAIIGGSALGGAARSELTASALLNPHHWARKVPGLRRLTVDKLFQPTAADEYARAQPDRWNLAKPRSLVGLAQRDTQ